jgi:hypothetical protein
MGDASKWIHIQVGTFFGPTSLDSKSARQIGTVDSPGTPGKSVERHKANLHELERCQSVCECLR